MMLDKRGIGHHIDWIIGTSVFLLYIVFVIVTLKPGVKPLNEGEVLLDMVQDNFIANVSWNITKVPLNIIGSPTVPCNSLFSISFPYDWSNSNTRIYNKNNQQIDFGISGSNLVVYYGNEAQIKREYILLHSTDSLFNGMGSSKTSVCTDSNYIYGVPELLRGLSSTRIGHLKTYAETNYEQLKNDWKHYPKTSDFSITVENNKIVGKAPPANANVYVRQLVEFELKDTGEKVPVDIIIKAW